VAGAQESQDPEQREIPSFGGPTATGAVLNDDSAPKEPFFHNQSITDLSAPYFGFKRELVDKYGFAIGGDYSFVYQWASDSNDEQHGAAGQVRLFGAWTLIDRDGDNPGSLVWKVENRHQIGGYTTPFSLGFEAGGVLPTGTVWSDAGWILTNAFWQQRLFGGRATVLAGQIDTSDFLDIYGLVSPWKNFMNLAFLTGPTIALPNPGIGAGAGGRITDNYYAVATIADANADPESPSFDGFFDDKEYFYAGEVGYTSGPDRIFFDNIHVTVWRQDDRDDAGIDQSWGLNFSAAWLFDDPTGASKRLGGGRFMPFLRAGWSTGDAPPLNGSVALGLGYLMTDHDLIGVGAAWGAPSASGADNQWTFELFYRFQLMQNLAVTPDLQVIVDPPFSSEDVIWVPGVRFRLDF
jgi:porin